MRQRQPRCDSSSSREEASRQQDEAEMMATSEGCGTRLLRSAGDCSKRSRADTQDDGAELSWLNYTGELLGAQRCNLWS